MAALTLAALACWLAPRSRHAGALRGWALGSVLLHGMEPAAAQAVAERLRAEIDQGAPQHCGMPVTLSLGVTLAVGEPDFAMLWSQADAALYQAKQNGRNRVEPSAPLRGLP